MFIWPPYFPQILIFCIDLFATTTKWKYRWRHSITDLPDHLRWSRLSDNRRCHTEFPGVVLCRSLCRAFVRFGPDVRSRGERPVEIAGDQCAGCASEETANGRRSQAKQIALEWGLLGEEARTENSGEGRIVFQWRGIGFSSLPQSPRRSSCPRCALADSVCGCLLILLATLFAFEQGYNARCNIAPHRWLGRELCLEFC